MGSGAFQAFRETGRPTVYEDNKWPVTADTRIYGIIYCILILAFSFYVVIIGIKGIERFYAFVRVTLSLFIGGVILVCNFGYGWEYGSVTSEMQYKAFTTELVKAEIGLKLGLRGINVTLRGVPEHQLNETINYNERFSWEWNQGKPGFGPFAGRISREYRAAKLKGLPYPILWVLEAFTIDEGNFRNGRYYRTAGWYCHAFMWLAFPLWLLSNILFCMVVRYGAYFLTLTGGCLLLTNILFGSIRNSVPLVLHFDSKPLTLHYNWCFWLVLITGIICVILAMVILFMDLRYPEEIATFFGVDVLQDYEDFYADPADLGLVPPSIEVEASTSGEPQDNSKKSSSKEVYGLRKRTMSTRFQRSSQRHPLPLPRKVLTEEAKSEKTLPIYENINLKRFDPIGEEQEPKAGSTENILLRDPKGNDV